MKRFFGICLCFILISFNCFGLSAAGAPLSLSREEVDNFKKDGLFTLVPQELIDGIMNGNDPYGVLYSPKGHIMPCKFLRFYEVGHGRVLYNWGKAPAEIVKEYEKDRQEDNLKSHEYFWNHHYYFVISQSGYGVFSFTTYSNGKNASKYQEYRHLSDLLKTELQSINSYMVFDGQICHVQELFPFRMNYDTFLFYYITDKGTYVKYFPTTWKFETLSPVLFSIEDFDSVLEALYQADRVEFWEKINDPEYDDPIGVPSFPLISDMEKAGMEIPYCEAGNPIPAHLQEEINALRGVDETTRTEDSDRSDGTTDGGAVTDVPTDEGVVDVSTETATLTDAPPTDGTTSDVPLTYGTDAASTDTPTDPASFPWVWVIVPAGVVLIAAAATTALVIRKKKKQ